MWFDDTHEGGVRKVLSRCATLTEETGLARMLVIMMRYF